MNLKKYFVAFWLILFCTTAHSAIVILDITFDDFAIETGFGIWATADYDPDNIDFFSGIPYDVDATPPIGVGDGFILPADLDNETYSGTSWQFVWDLSPGDYTFVIFDSFGDGLCCDWGNGGYSLSVDGDVVVSGGVFELDERTDFTVSAVPLPGALVLLLSGLLPVGWLGIKRRSNTK